MSPRSIVITGASSGLGAALALEYAASGVVLGLVARNAQRLELITQACRTKGATVVPGSVDVTSPDAMKVWLEHFDREHPIDLCIANAGISAGPGFGNGEALSQVKEIFDVNVHGVTNTIHPVIECMRPRKNGQIAIISSIAGFYGLPTAPSYSASKAAVRVYGQALRALLFPAGIKVNVVCPGFIRTPMTEANRFPMPFMMEASQAARIIRRRLEQNKALISFPKVMAWAVRAQNILPDVLLRRFYRAVPAKPAKKG